MSNCLTNSVCPLRMRLKCALGALTLYGLGAVSHYYYLKYKGNKKCCRPNSVNFSDGDVCASCKHKFCSETGKCNCN